MKPRYYVGISDAKRRVFRSASVPERETHGSIYSAVIGPFRTKRAAKIMAEYGANNPHLQTVADAERIARENHVEMQDVYVASAWWENCDAFVTVCGNSPHLVEKTIFKAMRDAAIDAYNQSESEDKRRVRDYMDDIAWSGVNRFRFDAIVPHGVIAQYEEVYSQQHRNNTFIELVAHHPDMDYSDYEMLRNGRKDVVVYL